MTKISSIHLFWFYHSLLSKFLWHGMEFHGHGFTGSTHKLQIFQNYSKWPIQLPQVEAPCCPAVFHSLARNTSLSSSAHWTSKHMTRPAEETACTVVSGNPTLEAQCLYITNDHTTDEATVFWHCWLGDRKCIWPVKTQLGIVFWWWHSHWSFARLIAPVVTITTWYSTRRTADYFARQDKTSITLSSNKNQELRHSGTG